MPNIKPIISLEAEQAVLGAILLSPKYLPEIIELIRPEDFYRESHNLIYQAILEIFEKDAPIDYTSVFIRLKEKGQETITGGMEFLMNLAEHVGTATNIKYYAQIVHDKSTIRRLQQIALTILNDCQNGGQPEASELLEKAKERFTDIYEGVRFKGGKNITQKLRDYLEVTEGIIAVTDIYKTLGLVTSVTKKAALMALGRLVKEGILVRIRPGFYRLKEKDTIRLRLSEAKYMGDEIDMRYPCKLECWYKTFAKTVAVISGEPDAGKTAWMLNLARMNMHHAPIYYWTSEMGLPELYERISEFEDFNEQIWDEKVEFNERSENFADVVSLYPNSIHLIDNLEMSDNFYQVAGHIDAIWRALIKGVAVIAIHRDPGKELPQGGVGAIKRPRLWLDLKPKKGGGNIMQVRKIKNWRDKLTNIKGKNIEYSLVRGCRIIQWE